MSRNLCCVPGCPVRNRSVEPLQKFPNPDKDLDSFNIWISRIGGEVTNLNKKFVYNNRSVCRRHFVEVYHYPKNRLCRLAVPSLHMPLTDTPEPEGQENMPVIENDVLDIQHNLQIEDNIEVRQSISDEDSARQRRVKGTATRKFLKKRAEIAKAVINTKQFKVLTRKMTKAARKFFAMQVRLAGRHTRKSKGRRFTLSEKILALALYKPSPKAYKVLSQLCVLPTKRTLQDLLQKINLKPGINEKVFSHLKKRLTHMAEPHKLCSLMFDEMSITPNCTYNRGSDFIHGFVDNGNQRGKQLCDHVIVFMIKGVVKKYKQPICYNFVSGTIKTIDLKEQIKNIISKLQDIGLQVVSTVCDQGATNMAAINQLQRETKETYLRNEERYEGNFIKIGNQKIFSLFDPPHLMKGIRNNMLTKNLAYTMNGSEHTAKWAHIRLLFERDIGYRGVKLFPKLTAQHVVPELIPKMKVKHSTQVFSKSVGAALGYMAETGNIPKECIETADVLMFFDDLFDSVNGSFSEIRGGKKYRAAVKPNSPHHTLWNYSLPILKSMKFVKHNMRKGSVPSLVSWIRTIEGFQSLVKFLNTKGVNSLLLRNFNQDSLENFFGAIRAHGFGNIMPSSTAFESAFKTLLVNNFTSAHTIGFNCEKDDSFYLQSLNFFLTESSEIEPTNVSCNMVDAGHLNIPLMDTNSIIQGSSRNEREKCAAIAYCSGWLAHKIKPVVKSCQTCNDNLREDEASFHKYINFKEFSNKRWLCYPTRELFNFFAHVEEICNVVLKDCANQNNIAAYIKVVISVNIDTNFIKCPEHKQKVTSTLINKSVLFFVHNWCKEINSILTGKCPLWDKEDPYKVLAEQIYKKYKTKKRKRQTGVLVNF